MRPNKTLKRVKDRFSLFNDGRKLNANKRNYIVKAVQNMIASTKTQELLRVGEAYGYYGHQPRTRAKRLDIGETEIIMIKDRPVVVENIPSNRTISISCSDDGIVEHEEEFFETEMGRIALSMWESGVGGWSWAIGGLDSPKISLPKTFYGMDYVKNPNYLSLDHPSMMLESNDRESMMLESLQSNGFDAVTAHSIYNSINNAHYYDDNLELENEIVYLEGLNSDLSKQIAQQELQQAMLLESLNSLPVYISDSQKAALSNMQDPESQRIVRKLFESLNNHQAQTLPTAMFESANSHAGGVVQHDRGLMKHQINYGQQGLMFPKS